MMEKITAAFCLLTIMGVFSATVAETNFSTPAISVSDGNATAGDDSKGSTISSTTPLQPGGNQTLNTTVQSASPDSDNTTETSGTTENIPTPGPETEKPTTVSTTISTKAKTKSTTQRKKITTIPPPLPTKGSKIYIIILIIIIICILAVMAYCCLQSKTRKFSLERHSKNEDAQIPLSAVDPEVFEAASLKDMQTFTAAEDSATPADGVEKQDGDKAPPEDNQQEKEGSTDTQATAPLTEKVGELTVVDLNDGEPAISTKTSVESLDEPLNENNSNNRAWASASGNFTEICLNDLH